MANLRDWILEEAKGEPIEAVVIGDMGWGDGFHSESVSTWSQQRRGVVLRWDEAEPMLNYEFYDGPGAPGCNRVYAWTPSRVIAVFTDEGSTVPFSIPRNPTDCDPIMPGGR